jgi:hypothetical protein
MNDLVERLRADLFMQPPPTKLQLEAADEIERLRAALQYLVKESDPDMDDDYNPHSAPLARARAALEPKP